MTEIYIHAGHEETATEYIQEALLKKSRELGDLDIIYFEENGYKKKTGIDHKKFFSYLDGCRLSEKSKVLVSSDLFFKNFVKEDKNLISKLEGFFDKIVFLLFIRNPVEHAISLYQKKVMHGGLVDSYKDFFDKYSYPEDVCKFINSISTSKKAELKIKNYSCCQTDLLLEFSEWLGVNSDVLEEPAYKEPLRYLTNSELEFQIETNKILGPSGGVISVPLCKKIKRTKYEGIYIPENLQKSMIERLSFFIKKVNFFVEKKHQYRNDFLSTDLENHSYKGEFLLTKKQVEVIASSFSSKIFKLQSQLDSSSHDYELKKIKKEKFNRRYISKFYLEEKKSLEEEWTNAKKLKGSKGLEYLSVVDVVSFVESSLETKKGFSVIRSGDGEGCFLYNKLYDSSEELFEFCANKTLGIHFGDRGFSFKDCLFWSNELYEAFLGSDIITTARKERMIDRLLVDNNSTDYRALVGQVAGSILPIRMSVDHDKMIYDNGFLHRDLIPYYSELFNGRDVVLIGPNEADFCKSFEINFKCFVSSFITIPGQFSVIREDLSSPLYPDKYQDVVDKIFGLELKGKLVLVGAGIAGKPICSRVAALGGVALDVGSLMDAWAGQSARLYHDENFIKKVSINKV